MVWSGLLVAPGTRRIETDAGTNPSNQEESMKKAIVVLVLAMIGCAGSSSQVEKSRDNPLAGMWAGVIDRDGWQRPVALSIKAQKDGSYTGSWMSVENQPGVMLDTVRRTGDDVEFELQNLRFDGKVQGRQIAGTVAGRDRSSSGNFTLARVDPVAPPSEGP
jgi:hypothetical protein